MGAVTEMSYFKIDVSRDYLDEHKRRQPRQVPLVELMITVGKSDRVRAIELTQGDLIDIIADASIALRTTYGETS